MRAKWWHVTWIILFSASGVPGGEFNNLKLVLDTKVEEPAQNNNVVTAPILVSGDSLKIQLFLPGGAGKKMLGFDLEFENTGNVLTDNFFAPSGRDFLGQ